jgi:hypothetical protein
MNTTTRLAPDHCTACKALCTAATVTDVAEAVPEPGHFTICFECGHIMVFGEDLRLRDPTAAECWEIAGDKNILAAQKARVQVQELRRRAGGPGGPGSGQGGQGDL